MDPTLVGVLYFLTTTAIGVVVWGVRLLARGDLITKQSLEYTTNTWKQQLEEKKAEAAEWKSLYEAERALGVNSRENREILLAVSKTMTKVLSALPSATSEDVGG